ncbi:MAG TPA: hypothetical protein VGI21_07220 [Streptosporangiaceae bacterium]|jgi:hypothetical protein
MANHDDQDWRDGDAAGKPEPRGGGIYVSGGNYGAVAQGHQARAVSVSHGVADSQLARLQQLLEELADQVSEVGGPAADDALDDLDRAQDELRRRRPDRHRMIELVTRVGTVVAPVSGLAELADHIKDLIGLAVH